MNKGWAKARRSKKLGSIAIWRSKQKAHAIGRFRKRFGWTENSSEIFDF